MLRKRTRSHQKDQNMGQLTSDVSESYFHSDFLVHKHKNSSFFNAPGLFVGFNPKGSESDSVRSPTSPLDFRLFSSFGNPFRSPRSSHEGHHKIWDSNKVGLSIIDSLDHEDKQLGKVLRASESKNILFGPQMRIKTLKSPMHTESLEEPKSLPKNIGIFPYSNARPSSLQKGSSDVLFEIGDAPSELEPNFRPCSLDSGRSGLRLGRLAKNNSYLGSRSFVCENGCDLVPSTVKIAGGSKLSNMSDAEQHSVQASTGSSNGLIGTLPPSEIELSEDYTCVRIHGPNPKVTHIFGDCILECHNNELTNFGKNNKDDGMILPQTAECSEAPVSYPANDFLSSCYSCKKKLDGEDIYMYRGEKAFCSWNCRLQEILIDEEAEETNNNNTNAEGIASPSRPEEHSEPSLFTST